MKKSTFTTILFLLIINYLSAQTTSACTGLCPYQHSEFIASKTKPFNQTINVGWKIPDTVMTLNATSHIILDSIKFEGISQLPLGMHFSTSCGSIDSGCTFKTSTNNYISLSGIPVKSGYYEIKLLFIEFQHQDNPSGLTTYNDTFSYYIDALDHPLISVVNSYNVSSFGLCDGSAEVLAGYGAAPFKFLWSSGDTTSYIQSKCSDKYTVVVSDSNNNTDSVSVYISEPSTPINNTTPSTPAPIDTIITNYDTCIVDYNYPIDSAFVESYTMIDSTNLSVDYAIYQGGNKITFTANFSFDSVGSNLLVLNLECKGTFSRAIKSTTILQSVNLQYNQIGTIQSVPHLSNLSSGIDKINAIQIVKVYPNPFSLQTTITLNQYVKNGTVKITNVLGETIKTINFSGAQVVIDRGDLSSGIYFIQIITNDKLIATEKIVIQ